MAKLNDNLDILIGGYIVSLSPELGRGSYGTVFKAKNTVTENLCVAKKIDLTSNVVRSKALLEAAKTEEKILQKLNHQNIVRYLDVFRHKTSYWIFLEFCSEGNLKDHIVKNDFLSEKTKIGIYLQCAKAVQYIHANFVVHRDIKLGNYLVTKISDQFVVKLTDFGLSKLFEDQEGAVNMKTRVGTRYYRAPELISGTEYSDTVDIFSLGLVILVVLKYGPEHLETVPLTENGKCIGEEMLNREVHLVKLTNADMRGSVEGQIKELIIEMTYKQPEKRIKIDAVCLKLEELSRSAASTSASYRENETTWSLSTSTESTADVLRGINSAGTTNEAQDTDLNQHQTKEEMNDLQIDDGACTEYIKLSDSNARESNGIDTDAKRHIRDDQHCVTTTKPQIGIEDKSITDTARASSSDDQDTKSEDSKSYLANRKVLKHSDGIHSKSPKPCIAATGDEITVTLCQDIINGNEELVFIKLKNDLIKRHINDRIPTKFLRNHRLPDVIKWTTLICCGSRISSLRVLQALMETGADIYNVNNHGDSALKMSCFIDKDRLPKIQYLIKNDSNQVNATDFELYTPLHTASQMGLVDVIPLLLNHGANVNARTYLGVTCFHIAAMCNRTQVMDLLLAHGARIDDRTNSNGMPIHDAAYHGALEAVAFLLDKGIDINVSGISNQSPLSTAAIEGRINVVDELLRRGADVKHQDVYGATALHIAACKGHLNVLKALVCADPECIQIKDKNGWDVVRVATESKQRQIVVFLKRFQTDYPVAARLRQNAATIESSLRYPSNLLDVLLEKGAISSKEHNIARSKSSKTEKARCMMSLLFAKKDVSWASTFLQALRTMEPDISEELA